ncbi:MAG TPA: hypothetical protein VM754_12340 [Actinomycetota bacterium]|nr:hypothetical protein [Actinomycetota bacterium]
MAYQLINTATRQKRVCRTLSEAHQKVNEIVTGQEEWSVFRLPEEVGIVGYPVSNGSGPIPS